MAKKVCKWITTFDYNDKGMKRMRFCLCIVCSFRVSLDKLKMAFTACNRSIDRILMVALQS